ncbi:MAG: 50S ribosomal protein L6 [Fusobacteriaceae bacterium]|nr:50S ribosomal protein L6 [Fusobacteriaceae bacterium]MBP6322314.1 50S ribosomal protein L6 [Fusobacteriaceae bacterium]
MSRVGNKLINVPAGVEVTLNGNVVTVKGPKGTLTKEFSNELVIKLENGVLTVERPNDLPATRAIHGTTRALINNMIVGVSQGFKKTLTLVGVGYKATEKNKGLEMALGFSHPVIIDAVDGLTMTVEKNTTINIEGIEKDVVGQIAAEIRSKRPPEPYKGKGVKYSDEVVRRKEGKKS